MPSTDEAKRRRSARIIASACWSYLALYAVRFALAMRGLPDMPSSWGGITFGWTDIVSVVVAIVGATFATVVAVRSGTQKP